MPRVQVIESGLTFANELVPRPHTDFITIHHTGGNAGDDYSAAEIHAMHLANGWSGIGYHEVYRKNGTVETGRPLWARGAHSIPGNNNSLGLHLCGNFDLEDPTPAQLNSLAARCADHCEYYRLNPFAAIVGHRDQDATDCPGNNLYALLPEIRQRTADLLPRALPGG